MVLLYRFLTTASATALTAMTSPEGDITCEFNIAWNLDKMLYCACNALTERGNIYTG